MQVTLEEQMICGALQTLNEDAYEDVASSERPSPSGLPTGEMLMIGAQQQQQPHPHPQQQQQLFLATIRETLECCSPSDEKKFLTNQRRSYSKPEVHGDLHYRHLDDYDHDDNTHNHFCNHTVTTNANYYHNIYQQQQQQQKSSHNSVRTYTNRLSAIRPEVGSVSTKNLNLVATSTGNTLPPRPQSLVEDISLCREGSFYSALDLVNIKGQSASESGLPCVLLITTESDPNFLKEKDTQL